MSDQFGRDIHTGKQGMAERRHGREHPGHEKFLELGNVDDLNRLMRACGHFLYHNGEQRNGQGRIMRILCEAGQIGQKELQDMLEIQAGSMSEILAKLENKGLIERRRDAGDRRRIIVCITEKGRTHGKEIREKRERQDLFAVLDDGQKEQLRTLLKLLIDSWEHTNQ